MTPTPPTKGTATPRPWFRGHAVFGHARLIWSTDKRMSDPIVTCKHLNDAAFIETVVNGWDALKAENERMREALKKIATTSQQEASNDPENLIVIAQEVLVNDCGQCGDDGEKPSNNCPTCKGSGFKRKSN